MNFKPEEILRKSIVLFTMLLVTIVVLTVKSGQYKSEMYIDDEDSKGQSEVFSFLFDDLPEQKSLELSGSREALNTLRDLRNRNALVWKVLKMEGSKGLECRVLNNETSQLLMVYEGELLIEVLKLEYDELIISNVEESYWYYQWNEDYQRILDNEITLGDSR